MWRRVRNLTMFFVFVLLGVLIVGGLWLAHSRAMTLVHPGRSLPNRTPLTYDIPAWDDVSIVTRDGLTLEGWFITPAPDGDGAVVIFVHGLGGNRASLLGQAALLVERGIGVLVYDSRNHGSSDGNVTTFGLTEQDDVHAAFEYVRARPEVDADRIALVGESMGGATVIHAAVELPSVRAVVVQSTYSSIEDNIAEGVEHFTGLPSFPFAPLVVWFGEQEAGMSITQIRPIDDIAQIAPRPVLIMHGTDDTLIDASNARRLYDAAGEPRELVLVEGAGHGAVFATDPEGFAEVFVRFLVEALG
jgi:hypothetical protein